MASTLDITNENFNNDNFVFESNGNNGSVINLGTITATNDSYVALLGKQVINEGIIVATKGTVSLNSGDKITLNFNGNSLVDVTINKGTLDSLVETKQAVYADGGKVILTAKAADDLIASQVNIEGLVQAQTIDDLKGEVIAYAYNGTTTVSGTIDASAPIKGDGGFIETSGDKVTIKDSATITTKSKTGKSGTWLIDPKDFTIGTGGDITGATLSQQLTNNNVEIQSVNGATEGNGNIYVNDAVSWSANTLTLDAQSNIYVNNVMNATGSANFVANYGSGSNSDGVPNGIYMAQGANGAFAGKIDFSGDGSFMLNNFYYTVLHNSAEIQSMTTSGNYILGSDITVEAIDVWGSGIGTFDSPYSGLFNGLGHTIALKQAAVAYSETSSKSRLSGLFGYTSNTSTISNIGILSDGVMSASGAYVGTLVNSNAGNIINAFAISTSNTAATSVISSQTTTAVGGLVGYNSGLIANSYTMPINLAGRYVTGGLVGINAGDIIDSFVQSNLITTGNGISVNATTAAYVGGLVGINEATGTVKRSYSNAKMNFGNSSSNVKGGGFVGKNEGIIEESYATGAMGSKGYLGSFVGENSGRISNAYASGNVTGSTNGAGFVYNNTATGIIEHAYTTAGVYGSYLHRFGFAHTNAGTLSDVYWNSTTGTSLMSDVTDAYAASLTNEQAHDIVNYLGFDTTIWGVSTVGYPTLKNIPIKVIQTTSTQYGNDANLPNTLSAIGLQWGDTISSLVLNALSSIKSASNYINAGSYSASSLLSSSGYSNLLGFITIDPKTLTISNAIANKAYDGTTSATASGNTVLNGLVGSETLTLDNLTGEFADKNAGEDKEVELNFTVSDGVNGGKVSNYKVSTTTIADIERKEVNADYTVATKVYDGSTNASATWLGNLNGVIENDSVSIASIAAAFADANAGSNKNVMVNGALSGTDSNNYVLTTANETGTIDKRVINLTGLKSWDGTTTVAASDLQVANIILGDSLILSGNAILNSSSPGMQNITSIANLMVDNPNYTLSGTTGSATVYNPTKSGTVVSGSANIVTSGNMTTITQTTDKAIINWSAFGVAPTETVAYIQPDSKSITLNRIIGNESTIIAGVITANGKVFFLNSNGILFTPTASVNVAGLLASTLNITDTDFLNGFYNFTGTTGSVINQGSLNVDLDSFIVFLGQDVSTSGEINAKSGDVVLVGGNNVSLALDGNNDTLSNVTAINKNGTVYIGGIVDLSSDISEGGKLLSMGNTFSVASNADVRTNGNDSNGKWFFISDGDFNIGSNLTGISLSKALSLSDIVLQTSLGDIVVADDFSWSSHTLTLDTVKNILINAIMTASGNGSFTAIYGDGTNSDGTSYGLYTKMGENDDGTFGGKIDFSGSGTVKMGTTNALNTYTVINSAAELDNIRNNQTIYYQTNDAGSAYDSERQVTVICGLSQGCLSSAIADYYVLGSDIDLSSIVDWSGFGYQKTILSNGNAVRQEKINFQSTINGFGHVINNLTSTSGGLINVADGKAVLSNIGVKSTLTPNDASLLAIGGLANISSADITNSFAITSLTTGVSGLSNIGGFVGSNGGNIRNSYSVVDFITSGTRVGGFVGTNSGEITNSRSAGKIVTTAGSMMVGGFAGLNYSNGRLISDYSSVNIFLNGGGSIVGGFVGANGYGTNGIQFAYISDSYSTGNIIGIGENIIGGFAGMNSGWSLIENSISRGNIDVNGNQVGGFVGFQGDTMAGVDGSIIRNSYAYGNVTSMGDYVGGFVGINAFNNLIENSHAYGNVKGRDWVGAFAGQNGSYILSALLDLTTWGGFNSIEEHIAFHFGISKDIVGTVQGAMIQNSSASGTVESTGDPSTSGAFAGGNIAGGKITDSYVSGEQDGRTLVGQSGVGDDWATEHFGADRGTSSESNNNFGSPEERAQWEAERLAQAQAEAARQEQERQAQEEAKKETQIAQDEIKKEQIQDISQSQMNSIVKERVKINNNLFAMLESMLSNSEIKDLVNDNVNVISPEFKADVKTINVDGVEYQVNDEDNEE